MRRLICLVVACVIAAMYAPAVSAASSVWHSETPVGPGIGVPTPLGEIGGMAFWAPNRGVLITAGIAGVMPSGVYAYDGTGWHLYSTVCGGHEGRIAWAGPDDFWTVSDYASEQEGGMQTKENARTLCHFENGAVVASYAEPFGTAGAYPKMDAAACDGPSDCWFAGEPLSTASPNQGPFHLHWDGVSPTAIPSLEEPQPQIEDPEGTVTGLAFFGGTLFENASTAPFLREVNLASPEVFAEVAVPEGATGPFALTGDAGQLWAVSESEPVALRSIGAGFEEIRFERKLSGGAESPVLLATEPNGAAVWAAESHFGTGPGTATLTRISGSGAESAPLSLPRPEEELNAKGTPSAIACPAAGQCWLATKKGWLFHLGEPLPQDIDPAMHVLITSRPSDNSTRTFVPGGLPEDNSGEVEEPKGSEEPGRAKFPTVRKPRPLVGPVHQRIVGKRTLQLSFVLHARAHVQLVAKYHHKVVAKTSRLTLPKGPHKLRVRLDPKRWPTGLDFRVHPASKPAS